MEKQTTPIQTREVTSWKEWATPRRLTRPRSDNKVRRRALHEADQAARKRWVEQQRAKPTTDIDALLGVIAILVVLTMIFVAMKVFL